MFCDFSRFVWAYSLEDIKIAVDDKCMEMKTKIINKSPLFISPGGIESIYYNSIGDYKTSYKKSLEG